VKGRQSRRVRQAGGNRSGNAAGCIYDSPTPRIRGKVSTQIVDSRILREPLNAPKNSSLQRHHECVMVVLSVISLVGVETQEQPDFAERLLAQGPEPISC